MSCNEFTGRGIPGTSSGTATVYCFAKATNTGAAKTFAIAESGRTAGIFGQTGASGDPVNVYPDGEGWLTVNGVSTNIVAGDLLKATTGGLGVKAGTDKDSYGAMALEPATTDAKTIRVLITRGDVSV